MNAEALRAKIRNIARDKAVDPQALMQVYFMDQFLLRLSLSQHREHVIVKGGMLMVALLGVSTRSTMDIDTSIKTYNLNEETAIELFDDIISIPYDDGCAFEFKKIDHIMKDNDYQGYRIFFTGRKEKMTQYLHLDLSTGDKITPKEVDLIYKTFLLEEEVNIKAYNIETVIAEKLETILTRGIANTRMKDFYDLYIVHKMLLPKISESVLKLAFKNTLANRETEFILDVKDDVLTDLSSDERVAKLWLEYSETYSYAQNITYSDCMTAVYVFVDLSL